MQHRRLSAFAVAIGITATVGVALADPPSHAPAHGWRKKHDPDYQGYSGRKWARDYGVLQGRCDAQTLSSTLGKSVGGAAGAKVGEKAGGEVRDIAVLVGEVLGEAISAKVLRGTGVGDIKDVDATDRACLAQALELARDDRKVAWTNPVSNVSYLLTPQRTYQKDGRQCRDFSLAVEGAGSRGNSRRTACATAAGTWEIRR